MAPKGPNKILYVLSFCYFGKLFAALANFPLHLAARCGIRCGIICCVSPEKVKQADYPRGGRRATVATHSTATLGFQYSNPFVQYSNPPASGQQPSSFNTATLQRIICYHVALALLFCAKNPLLSVVFNGFERTNMTKRTDRTLRRQS